MTEKTIFASAQPEKRLFISLLTRDISLLEAILDLIDNSINSTIIKQNIPLNTSDDYINLLDLKSDTSTPTVSIIFDKTKFLITDNCGGISLDLAQNQVFKFGKNDDETPDKHSEADRLSVYGIGLKRAIFKLGNNIRIRSNHANGGFDMDLDVRRWQREMQQPWAIPISPTPNDQSKPYGTNIEVKEIYENIAKRLTDDRFEGELRQIIAKTYSYFIGRIVNISVNSRPVVATDLKLGSNIASEKFEVDDVNVAVLAGISIPDGKSYSADKAGWYIFCNGRGVAFANKSNITGWGTFLPLFQPKFLPFIGIVFFASTDPESLPWTTTKSSINQESKVWQHALRVMSTQGRQITSFLSRRYPEEGVQLPIGELTKTAGTSSSALKSLSSPPQNFSSSNIRQKITSIQIKVSISDIDKIKTYLGNKSMSNADVGNYIFEYFLNNVVEED